MNAEFKTQEKQLLFGLRTRMSNVKLNFKTMYSDLTYNLCEENIPQSDSHLLECLRIINNCPVLSNDTSVEYEDLFGDISEQLNATKLYREVFEAKTLIELSQQQ